MSIFEFWLGIEDTEKNNLRDVLIQFAERNKSKMRMNEIDIIVELSLVETTVELFVTAFEEQNFPEDTINALYIIDRQLEALKTCIKRER